MTKRDLIEHLDQHGKGPNRQSILKNLIDLIMKGGFNEPPPKREESESSEEERGVPLGSITISSKGLRRLRRVRGWSS